jgi:hypothetical protein
MEEPVRGYSRSKWLVSEGDVFDERRLEVEIMHGTATPLNLDNSADLSMASLRCQIADTQLEANHVIDQLLYAVKPPCRYKSKSTQRI